jgi:transcription factor SPN1
MSPGSLDPPRPGDRGWVARARVPQPPHLGFTVRPKWKTDADLSKIKKKEPTKLDRHMRAAGDRKRLAISNRRAVAISLEGAKMPL